MMLPEQAWRDKAAWQETATKLAARFRENFKKYADAASPEIMAAGPKG